MWNIYTMEYYSVIKKNEIIPFVVTEIVLLSEVRQTENCKHHMLSRTCVIFKKGVTYELIYKKQSRCRKQNLWLPGGKRGLINWGIGIDIYTHIYSTVFKINN